MGTNGAASSKNGKNSASPAVSGSTKASHIFLRDVSVGMTFEGVYQVLGVQEKLARNNSVYSDLTLADKTSRQYVRIWKTAASTIVQKGNYARIEAHVDEYMGKPQIIANTVVKVEQPTPEEMAEFFVPTMPDREDDLKKFNELVEFVNSLCKTSQDHTCTLVLQHILTPETMAALKDAPGSAKPCYGAVGGALARASRVGMVTRSLCSRYKLDILEAAIAVTGALIHSVGSIKAFGFEGSTAIETKHGTLFGQGFLTSVQVANAVKAVSIQADAWPDTCERLAHAVASAWWCGPKPMTKEAVVLNAAMRSDYDAAQAVDFIDGDLGSDDDFTAYDQSTKRRFYRPKPREIGENS